jgi:hypothetical protein
LRRARRCAINSRMNDLIASPRLVLLTAASLCLLACPGPQTPDGGTDAGADVTLAAPTSGYQFAIPPFEVAKGTETQRCFFVEIPSDTEVYVNRFEIAQNTGSHHANVFRVKTIKGLSGMPGDSVLEGECWISSNWSDWPMITNSQTSTGEGYSNFEMPAGVAAKFAPHELIMIQTHYVNASTQVTPKRGKVLVNFHTVDKTAVTAELGTMFATNQSIKICPHETEKYFESKCGMSATDPVTIVGANSHFHSRGTYFSMAVVDATGDAGTPFYENRSWDDPKMAWNLNVPVPAGSAVKYHCEYSATTDACGNADAGCCFTFGGHVETQEHCNIFVYYYPKTRDVGCF